MTDKDAFAERGRALEEDYFRRRDAELIEKLRRRSEVETTRRRMADVTGVADEELLRDLQEHGFTPEMLRALPLVPLIQVAWADGTVSAAERARILEIAATQGLAPDSEAYAQLTAWLAQPPGPSVFESATRLIRAMFAALPPDQRAESQKDLVSYCTSIASASGGILGLGSISATEATLLKQLSAELERDHGDAVERLLKEGGGTVPWMP